MNLKLAGRDEEIIKLYTVEGWTIAQIAKSMKTKDMTVSNILKNNGVTIRKRGTSKNKFLIHDYFRQIDSPTKAYLLGFLFADGSVMYRKRSNSPGGVLALEVKESDKSILELLQSELRSELKMVPRTKGNSHTLSVKISSTELVKDLEQYGLVPNKTYSLNKVIPENLPLEYKIDFLAGLFDGDGSLYRRTIQNQTELFSATFTGFSEEYVGDFQKEIDLLIGKEIPTKVRKGTAYQATWGGRKDVLKIVNLLYDTNNYRLPRKKELAFKIINIG